MKNKYKVVFYYVEGEGFISFAPALSGCFADGKTLQESLTNLDVVIDEWIETAKLLGRDIPSIENDVFVHTNPDINDVASYFKMHYDISDIGKLQKLCFYCQIWSREWFSSPLFTNSFGMSVDGPVCFDLSDTQIHSLHIFSDTEKMVMNYTANIYGQESEEFIKDLIFSEMQMTDIAGNTAYIIDPSITPQEHKTDPVPVYV